MVVVQVFYKKAIMNITKKMREWAISNLEVTKDATDEDFKKAIGMALATGDLSNVKYIELSQDEADTEANEFTKEFGRLADGLEKAVSILTKESEKVEEKPEEKEEEKKTEPETKETSTEKKEEKSEPSKIEKMIGGMGGTSSETDGEKAMNIRCKEAVEQYDGTKSTLCYPETTKNGRPHQYAGQPVTEFGKTKNTSSPRDMALSGAWAKYQILAATPKLAGNPQLAWDRLSDHEKSLLSHLAEKTDWDNSQDGKASTMKGYPGGIKALIDDSTSGGTEAAPIVFDDQVIQTPLLYGELYPLVSTKTLDRGRRVEGVSTGTVTGSWGGVDSTEITLFNTASYVSAFDTTIYRWEGAIRIGLDFLSDTPIDFGQHITTQYGERLMEDLDDVIAVGNGTTQPEGIINKATATSVAWGGATSIGNYESLRFGVAKPEHGSNVKSSAIFCGTETSYQRARALNVGTNDARRLFGYSYDSYSLMERPYKINESLSNAQVFYAILARYRMYRRKGLAIRTTTEGDTLVRRNEMMIVAMARYGGQLERGACAAITTTAPA